MATQTATKTMLEQLRIIANCDEEEETFSTQSIGRECQQQVQILLTFNKVQAAAAVAVEL